MRLDLYKELYYKELERKENIHLRTQWSISIFVILLGASLYCINKLFEIENISFMMCLFCLLSIVCSLCSAVLLCKSIWAKKFLYLPIPSLIENYYQIDLHEHFKNESDSRKNTDDALSEYLIKTYIECTDKNRQINKEKMLDTTIANIIMIISFICLIVTFTFIFPEISKNKEIYNVQIIERSEN